MRRLIITGSVLVLILQQSLAQDLAIEIIPLPALRIQGEPAKAHTQGLEINSGNFYVTARRQDVSPRRALLLRTDARRTDWDVWDITPRDARGSLTSLDHPGGLQSDGRRLWIPVSEGQPRGRSRIRAYSIDSLVPDQTPKAAIEFPVDDHIGAVAVSTKRGMVFGANWDTESVYVWDFEGRLQRTLQGSELDRRGLGVVSGANGRSGLAVQDWKVIEDRLFASGLVRGSVVNSELPQSRWLIFTNFAEQNFRVASIALPKNAGAELGREAMALSDDVVYFLPEDIASSNRMFRASLASLLKRSAPPNATTPAAQ